MQYPSSGTELEQGRSGEENPEAQEQKFGRIVGNYALWIEK
jgi:hypothetical protein